LLIEGGSGVVTFSMDDADNVGWTPTGSRFVWEGQQVNIALGGRFNVMNALAAATCAKALDIPVEVIAKGLSALHGVPGRFELVDAGQPFSVIVDYAHTPDGLTNVLSAARQICEGRLIVVFGAGGDRDSTKRPLMGFAASRLADLLIVTSDNPRSEDPEAIVSDVLAGVSDAGGTALSQLDRAEAIATALATAQSGDVVVIAGKGHEKYQEVAGRLAAFDDVAVAREALERIASTRHGQQ
jgi:UDP-N-acetylmuramoyl-L-alanyl-D-glutamate--2,6-diaminopimelate ligase